MKEDAEEGPEATEGNDEYEEDVNDDMPSMPDVDVLEFDMDVNDEDDGEVMVREEEEVMPFIIAPFLISSHRSL